MDAESPSSAADPAGTGCGPGCTARARSASCSSGRSAPRAWPEVVATDRLGHRVDAALASGATTAIHVPADGPDPAAAVPVDVAFECAGTDEALDTAVRAVAPGGRVLVVGIPAGDRSAYPASAARRKEVALQLVRRMEAPDLGRAVALVAAGRVSLDGLVTHRFALDDAQRAFEVLASRAGLKVVIQPGGGAA